MRGIPPRRGRTLALALRASRLHRQSTREQEHLVTDRFETSEAMIPMRDGVRLHTRIFAPKDHGGPLPFIMLRTPYGTKSAGDNFVTYLKALADEGYIFVFQDLRGKVRVRRASSSCSVRHAHPATRRPSTKGPTPTTPSSGCSRTSPGNNGRVGMLGVSYLGWTTIMGCPRAASRAQGDLAAGLAGRHVARRRLPPQRRVPAQLRLRVRLRARERQGPEALRLRPLTTPTTGTSRSARWRTSTTSTSTARSRPGTTSWPTPTTTSSGSARR